MNADASPSPAATAAQAAAFDRHAEEDRLNRVTATLPPRDVAALPPSLRDTVAQLPPEHRAALDLAAVVPERDFAHLPPEETTAVLADLFAWRMVDIARAGVAELAGLESARAALSPEGYMVAAAAARARTRAEADRAHVALDGELGRQEAAAARSIAGHVAAGLAHPELELVVRARFSDALAAGPEAVSQLMDAHLASGDAAASRVLARVASSALAAIGIDDPRWPLADKVAPLAAAFAHAVKPPEVHRAEAMRVAIGATRQQLHQLRAVVGV